MRGIDDDDGGLADGGVADGGVADGGQADGGLADRARGGDRRALEDLLRGEYARIYGICRRLTGHDADAADATQNAVISIARGIRSFNGQSSFATWAYRIAVNASLDEIRRRQRRPVPADDVATVPSAGPDEGVGRLDIDAALRELPLEFRGPVVLRDLCGLDYREIEEVLRLRPGTVRSRISRGRAALASSLGEEPVS